MPFQTKNSILSGLPVRGGSVRRPTYQETQQTFYKLKKNVAFDYGDVHASQNKMKKILSPNEGKKSLADTMSNTFILSPGALNYHRRD